MNKIENYLGIANHDIQIANNSDELKSYVASLLCEIDELQQENKRLKEQVVDISNYIKYRNVSSAMQQRVLSYQIELENHYKIRYHELHNNWNKLKEYMINAEQIYKESDDEYVKDMHEIGIRHAYKTILCKIQELEKGRDE